MKLIINFESLERIRPPAGESGESDVSSGQCRDGEAGSTSDEMSWPGGKVARDSLRLRGHSLPLRYDVSSPMVQGQMLMAAV